MEAREFTLAVLLLAIIVLLSVTTRAVSYTHLQMMDLFNEDSPVKIAAEEAADGLVLTAHGVSAHGSKPEEGRNALAFMILFLNTLPLKKNAVSDAVYELAEYIGMQTDGTHLGIAASDESGALSLNLGYFRTTGEGVEAGIDIRYPIHTEKETVLSAVRSRMKGLSIEEMFSRPPHYVCLLYTSLRR